MFFKYFSGNFTHSNKNFIQCLYKVKMFKTLTNFVKSDNAKWIFVAIVVAIIVYSMMNYSKGKGMVLDNMTTGAAIKPNKYASNEVFESSKPASYDQPESVSASTSDYKSVDTAAPQDLLPVDKNSEFAKLNPVSSGKQDLPDLLQAGSLIGIDTIGQTLKNANLQLRSDPTIKKQNIGPWNNSTFEPDLARVPLELGCSTA